MKRIIAFALALAVVFGVSFALYKPERIEAAAQETMDDEWVGYFFAVKSRLLCKMLYNVFTISTYQN